MTDERELYEGSLEFVRLLLRQRGEDSEREGLQDTPQRFLKALDFWMSGYQRRPQDVLKLFEDGASGYDTMVFQANLPIYSTCEHHLAPFFGLAHVAYIPNKRIIGLSKIARVVDIFARRLQVQERLGSQIADCFMEHLEPEGVGVVLQCRHMCYSEDTEVLTDTGFKTFDCLHEGDRVAQFSGGVISFVRPKSFVAEKYSGVMHHWKTKSVDNLMTPEHRSLVCSEWKFGQGQDYSSVRTEDVKGSVYLPSAGIYDPLGGGVVRIGKIEFTQEQFCGFLGIYLSDGSFSNNPDQGYYVVITKTEQNLADFEKVRSFLHSLPLDWKPTRQIAGSTITGFSVRSRDLAAYVSQFGKSYDKYIPEDVFHMPLRARGKFMELYLHGDGWTMPSSSQMGGSSRSKRLTEGLQRLWVTSGYGCRVTSNLTGGSLQWTARARLSDGHSKGYNLVPSIHRDTGDYSSMVYCVNVPAGALVIRRQGSVSISGNCMESRGVQKAGTVTLTSALRGSLKDQPEVRAEFMALVNASVERTVL